MELDMHGRLILTLLSLLIFGCSDGIDRFHSISQKAIKNESHYYILDPIVGHIHKSNTSFFFPWPEHKDGKITSRTNNYGFRRDEEIFSNKQNKTRILLTGDSHIDGVINNSESCCTILENILDKLFDSKSFEVINSGVGHYFTKNYLGILKKYLYLSPDVFIVIIYGGNDFIEACRLEGCKRSYNPNYYIKLQKIKSLNPGGLWQGLNQIYYFKFFPESQEIAFKSMTDDLNEIKEICKSNNIALIVLLLPSKFDVEWSSDETRLNNCKDLLQLTDDDLQINLKLLDKLANWLNTNKFTYLELKDYMKNKEHKLFWNEDYHLNDNGHKIIAEALFTNYKGLFLRIRNCQPTSPSLPPTSGLQELPGFSFAATATR